MTVYIANDHGGYALKKAITVHLRSKNIKVVNEGSDSCDIVRYPYYAAKVSTAVATKKADFGILICNSGIGMSMVANKFCGVRAALVTDEESAMLTRQHNDANVICLGGKHLDEATAIKLVDIFLETQFLGDRHSISVGLIEKIENCNFSDSMWNEYDAEKSGFREDFYALPRPNPANILLDTDMMTDCDDTAALALLIKLEKMGKANILGVTVSGSYPMSAPVVDAINTYYGRGDIPLGAPKNGTGYRREDSCFLDKVAAEFPHKTATNDEAEDAVSVMRRALAEARDESVTLVTIGYMSNVKTLMQSGADDISPLSGMELIQRKVREWVCMGGNFPKDTAADNVNFTRDPVPAVYAIRNFPKRITFAGREIGHNIFVGNDFHNMPDDNPVKRAYELHRGRWGDNWDHHIADPCTVLYAVFGLDELFEVQSGTMTLNDNCSFDWDPTKLSNMAYLLQKADRTKTAKFINDLIMQ